jgi:hypothetical protein
MFRVSAVFRQPADAIYDFRGEFDASFVDFESFMVDLALAGDDVEEAAGDDGVQNGAVPFHPLLETALPAPVADRFPILHY